MNQILYVEDDEITAFITQFYLKQWHVVLAHNAETGLELAKETYFPVVLLDINLGEGKMTGTQAMKVLKNNPNYQNATFVAVTAYTMPEHRKLFLEEGFDEYFSKPVNYEKLIEYIEEKVAGSQLPVSSF